jgi:predicted amidohydrolase
MICRVNSSKPLGAALRVAAIQMSSQADLQANLASVEALARAAVEAGAQCLVLPENFAYFGEDDTGKLAIAERVELGPPGAFADGPILASLRRIARAHEVAIVGGGMPETSPSADKVYNTSVMVAPDGAVLARYRKIHMFDVVLPDGTSYCESSRTARGEEVVDVELAAWRVGLTICYDLRFPELYRALGQRGCNLVTVPAAFTLLTGKDHWHALLRARAIENQCYVVAAAQHGKHPRGRMTFGKALIVDPWGEVVAQASEGPGFALATLDLAYLQRVREMLPALEHIRLA